MTGGVGGSGGLPSTGGIGGSGNGPSGAAGHLGDSAGAGALAGAGAGGTGGGILGESSGGSSKGGSGMLGGSSGGSSRGGSGNSGSAGMGGGSAGGSSANCSLTVKVTTASAGGRYAPRNIGAIWVADHSGNFIRSLEVWAQRRVNFLSLWNSATSRAGTPGNRVDIISQATLSNHVAHTATWECQDFDGEPVADGTYRVYFEMTDNSSAGPNRFEEFTKGPAPMTSTPSDDNNFKAIELSFKP
jgi:hypothetical protein